MQHERRDAAHMQRLVAGLGTGWHWLAGTLQGGSDSECGVVGFRAEKTPTQLEALKLAEDEVSAPLASP